jgi:hypothetical protein
LTNKGALTQKDLRKIRQELSLELTRMSPDQKKEYFEAAKQVYRGLEKMSKIARMAST